MVEVHYLKGIILGEDVRILNEIVKYIQELKRPWQRTLKTISSYSSHCKYCNKLPTKVTTATSKYGALNSMTTDH